MKRTLKFFTDTVPAAFKVLIVTICVLPLILLASPVLFLAMTEAEQEEER